jgi:large subunit ribosomal protein L28
MTNIATEKRGVIRVAFRRQYDSMLEHMAKVCDITKKGSIRGGGYSNRTRATQFNPTGIVRKYPNLQNKKVYVPELKKSFALTLSTKAIKTIQKNGAFATLKKAGIIK